MKQNGGSAAVMKTMKRVCGVLVLAAPMLAVVGCGGSSSAPLGSTFSIQPTSLTWVGAGLTTTCAPGGADRWVYDPVTITLLASNGRPVANTTINYSLSLTAETILTGGGGGIAPLQTLFLGPPVPGAAPPPVAQIAGAGSLNTDNGGNIYLIIGTDSDCVHKSSLSVNSASTYGTMEIDVQ
jgi:hypothetical protein